MYQLIAIDLDGTLLNSYGVVTDRTKQTIKKCIDKGIEIVLASGRPNDSIEAIAKEIGAEHYFIAGNGALIYDIKKQKVIYEKYMSKEKVLEIIKISEQNSISYNVYTDKTILATSLKYNVLYYHKENLKKEESKKTHINIVDDMYTYVKQMQEEKFLKITICDTNSNVFNAIIRKMKQIKGIDILEVSHMSRKIIKQGTEDVPIEYYYTEISLQEVDKYNALQFLQKKLNIKNEETIAIGDNMNDKKMIQKAGMGIAMKQSCPAIIEVADYVTEGNNEDGVAKALENFVKLDR